MTDEYIKREDAEKCAEEIINHPIEDGFRDSIEILSAIHNLPAAEVRPVVRGKWVQIGGKYSRDKMIDRRILTCSVCGNDICMEGVNAGRGDANFCPNCGADMREES